MKTCIYLSYVGLGANLLHLSYCHQIARKFGPVSIVTICKNLNEALNEDPLIKDVYYLENYHKKFIDIFKLSKKLKQFKFDQILIFYPSLRIYLAAKLAGIKKIYTYPIFKKKNLHLVKAAKNFTESFLNIQNCPTETKFYISEEKLNNAKQQFKENYFKIIIGAGSSGPTTKWGSKNYSELINKLNEKGNYFFFILCGPNEKIISDEISSKIVKKNFFCLNNKSIKNVIPYLCSANMYVGNDSFGSHITSQSGLKSLIVLLDSPKAYTDYSNNFYRIIPDDKKIEDITHGTEINPDSISVKKVLEKIISLQN